MSLINSLTLSNSFYGITTTKGDLLVNDGIKNNRLPVGSNAYVLTADSTEPTGIKWALPTATEGNVIEYFQYILTTLPISTNSTTPISIAEFQSTPPLGNYVILINITYSLSSLNRSCTFGLYKNGTLIPDSSTTIDGTGSEKKTIYYFQFVETFSGSDIFTVRFNTNNINATAIIYEGILQLIKFTNASQYVTTNSDFSTNSISPIAIPDLTNTPISGVFLVLFNSVFSVAKNNQSITVGLYSDGSLISGSSRTLIPIINSRTMCQMNVVTSFSGSNILTVRVNSSSISSDVVIYDRNLTIIPLA
jgi:hypothetical protein